jgi:5-formyltetrahydrofolate cyclo-ligase
MEKKELRKLMLAERKKLSLEEVDHRSEQLTKLFFFGFSLKPLHTVHVFLPILKNREINTWPIIQKIWRDYPDCKVAVSVTNFETNELEHFFITPETAIAENHWGIPEPLHAQPASESEMDFVLVPLLTFDLQGHRLGYGKGYYDRFLAKCSPETIKVGLSLLPPVAEITGIHEGDVAMDYCLTPEKCYPF